MNDYRNVYFSYKDACIQLKTSDDNGEKLLKTIPYAPYLMIEDPNGEYNSIFNTKLKKIYFRNPSERRDFATTCNEMIYGNLPVEQQFLLDYYKDIKTDDIKDNKLHCLYFDIEVYSKNEFPDPRSAKHPITTIACYSNLENVFYVFGTKDYDPTNIKDYIEDWDGIVKYNKCIDEKDLLKKFIAFFKKQNADILIGYNSEKFDIPYVVNRIEKILGERQSNKLSPFGWVTRRKKLDRFFSEYEAMEIKGVGHLDFHDLFRYMRPDVVLDNYKLETVAQEILGYGKVAYDGSLAELYDLDFETYVNYNIQDVKILKDLDAELQFVEIAQLITKSGFCNIEKILGKSAIVTGCMAKVALDQDKYIITSGNNATADHSSIVGGYVKDAELGIKNNVVYFDAQSLYPSIMIGINCGIDTFRGTFEIVDGKRVFDFDGKSYSLPMKEFNAFLKEKNLTATGAQCFFTKDFKSLTTIFCEELFEKRKNNKGQKLFYEDKAKKLDPKSDEYHQAKSKEIYYDNQQYCQKILLNSVYGVQLNANFALYHRYSGESVTKTGQKITQNAIKLMNKLVADGRDCVVCADTDSLAVDISEYLKDRNALICDDNLDLSAVYLEFEKRVQSEINKSINDMCDTFFNFTKEMIYFKREAVCSAALYMAKKNYILRVINNENVKKDELKFKGAMNKAIVSKNIKRFCQQQINDIIHLRSTEKDLTDSITEYRERVFTSLPLNDIAQRSNVRNIDKFIIDPKSFDCKKGTPHHIKAAHAFNVMLHFNGLSNKIKPIKSGDRLFLVPLEHNFYDVSKVAFTESLPTEFGVRINYDAAFDKTVLYYLKPLFNSLNWSLPSSKITSYKL